MFLKNAPTLLPAACWYLVVYLSRCLFQYWLVHTLAKSECFLSKFSFSLSATKRQICSLYIFQRCIWSCIPRGNVDICHRIRFTFHTQIHTPVVHILYLSVCLSLSLSLIVIYFLYIHRHMHPDSLRLFVCMLKYSDENKLTPPWMWLSINSRRNLLVTEIFYDKSGVTNRQSTNYLSMAGSGTIFVTDISLKLNLSLTPDYVSPLRRVEYEFGLNSSYNDVISAVDNFFGRRDSSTV